MPELIELSRNELLRAALQARDERDAVTEELAKSTDKLITMASKLHESEKKVTIYLAAFCLAAAGALGLTITLLIKLGQHA